MSSLLADKISEAYRSVYQHTDFIPLHAPVFGEQEKKYVLDCVETAWVSSVGSYVNKIGEQICELSGAKYAVPTSSGTSALHLSLVALGISKGQIVLCPDISFVATAAAIRYADAIPAFIDVCPDTLGIDPNKIRDFISDKCVVRDGKLYEKETNYRVSAVMGMHNVGFPIATKQVLDICEEYGLFFIEDAAESLGSIDESGKMCGTVGDVGVYSFNGNKIITTGGGGVLVTNDETVFKKALHLSTTAKVPHPYLYEHDDIGFNYRMPNINAALGCAQLERFEEILKVKSQQSDSIDAGLEGLGGLSIKKAPLGKENNWFKIVELSDCKAEELIPKLSEKGIMARPLWSQISKMPPYKDFPKGEIEEASGVINRIVCLPNGIAKL